MDVNPEARPKKPTPLFPRGGGGEGALFGVMAIMSFLACLTLALALGAARLAHAWEQGLSGQATVQIVEHDAAPMEAQIEAALTILKSTPGIADSVRLSPSESAELLRPWLGDVDLAAVPVPVLIAVTLDGDVRLDAVKLREDLARVAPGATFDDHSRWNEGLTAASATIGWGAYAILALIALAAAASVVFAVRAALNAHRDVVDVLHMTGARPGFIAGQVQGRFFMLGGEAGLAGLTGALIFVVAIALVGSADALFLPALKPGWSDILWFLAVPFTAAIIAMLTARYAVSRFLAER